MLIEFRKGIPGVYNPEDRERWHISQKEKKRKAEELAKSAPPTPPLPSSLPIWERICAILLGAEDYV
jgi:hypothetical protein